MARLCHSVLYSFFVKTFESHDLGAIALARAALLEGETSLELTVGGSAMAPFGAEKLLLLAAERTRFGRIGVLYDAAYGHIFGPNIQDMSSMNVAFLAVKRTSRVALEPQLRCAWVGAGGLLGLAQYGKEDSVEFRRLARTTLRPLKRANIDTLVVAPSLLATEDSVRVLRHIAGRQIRVISAQDLFMKAPPKEGRSVIIHTAFDPVWTQKRAEQILRTQLPAGCVRAINTGT